MLWVDRVLDWTPGAIACEVEIRDDSPFLDGDRVDSVVAIEFMAQAIAAHAGMKAYRGGGTPHLGYIIAVQGLELEVTRFEPGDRLRVDVENVWGDEILGKYTCTLRLGSEIVARGSISVFQDVRGNGRSPLAGTS
jgi:predicted hotdog family 3-hydroxylacyl-ACP dehydratase